MQQFICRGNGIDMLAINLKNIHEQHSINTLGVFFFQDRDDGKRLNRGVNDVNGEDNYIRTILLTYAELRLLNAKRFQSSLVRLPTEISSDIRSFADFNFFLQKYKL